MTITGLSMGSAIASSTTDKGMASQKREKHYNTNKPILSFQNAESNQKEDKKSFLAKKAMTIAFGLATAVAIGAIFKNFKMSKQLADVTTKLTQTTTELNTTKAALRNAENTIAKVQEILNTPAKSSFGETFTRIITSATKGLRLTNELSSEVTQFLTHSGNIKRLMA